MPRPAVVDPGRGFGMTMSHNWEQRIEKEERAMLRTQDRGASGHFVRERRRRSTRAAAASLTSLPEDLRGIGSWQLYDRNLINARQHRRSDRDTGVLHLEFVPESVPAHWVPGSHRINVYRPQFSIIGKDGLPIDATGGSQSTASLPPPEPIWRRAPAGMDSGSIAKANAPGGRMSREEPETPGGL
ncbi:unnamed protein product [Polarella glacialis]|uniref:Uncharacterized protein n=1 Tax=Polarella glacialis TaxID=89957 RepID=A0A813FLD9_POLGL|nr:unnamed protein product [Polarella glacialis]